MLEIDAIFIYNIDNLPFTLPLEHAQSNYIFYVQVEHPHLQHLVSRNGRINYFPVIQRHSFHGNKATITPIRSGC